MKWQLKTCRKSPAAIYTDDELTGWTGQCVQAVGDGMVPEAGSILEQLGGDGNLSTGLKQEDSHQDCEWAAA